jgi:hypothetical protein
MSNDAMSRQSSDAANSKGFGTNQLSPNQGEFLKSAPLNQTANSEKVPARDSGTR